MKNKKLKIFSGRSNPTLAKNIASTLNQELGKISIQTFADGEIWGKYEENSLNPIFFISLSIFL